MALKVRIAAGNHPAAMIVIVLLSKAVADSIVCFGGPSYGL
jgi:hypothetical protein